MLWFAYTPRCTARAKGILINSRGRIEEFAALVTSKPERDSVLSQLRALSCSTKVRMSADMKADETADPGRA